MSWFSILPAHLTIIETWIIRFFVGSHLPHSPSQLHSKRASRLTQSQSSLPQVLLGILTIGPWLVVIVYDLVLYIVRAAAYEIPFFGGRARGRQKPRAPTLAERPSGRARNFSIGTTALTGDEKIELLRRRTLSDTGEFEKEKS